MLPASRAACVPVFMATPTSAWASAGASLVPSPHIATSLPCRLLLADQLELVLGRRLGEEVVDARLGGDRGRGQRVVAGDHHRADAHRAQLGEALADAALDDVLEVDDAEQRGRPRRRRAACRRLARCCSATALEARAAGAAAAPCAHVLERWRRRRPCGSAGRRRRRRSCGSARERDEAARAAAPSRAAQAVLLLGQHDDRAALGRLVGQAGELRRVGQLALAHAGHRA